MKRIISAILFVFVLASMFTVMASATEAVPAPVPGEMVAKAIYGTPEVDGYADSIWDEAEIQYLNHVFVEDGITEPSKVRFRTMWDEKYLYFLVEVIDSTMGDADWEGLMLGGNLWRRDGISFTFSPDYDRGSTDNQVAPAFWFIIAAYGNTANWNSVPQNVFISEDEGVTKMYAISYNTDYTTNTNYGYTLECKVNLVPRCETVKMEAGAKFGFDMYNNNNNNLLMSANREYGLTWGGSVNSYKNNAEKGTLELCAKDVKFQNSEETLKWFPEITAADTTTEAPVETTPAPVETTTPAPVETTTPAPEETTTEAPVETTPAPVETTPAPTETTPAPAKGGCGSVAAASAVVALVAVLGGAVMLNKKEN